MASTGLVVLGLFLLTLLSSLVSSQTEAQSQDHLLVIGQPNLYVMNMSGKVEHVVGISQSYGVAFDPTTARIYWTNYDARSIESSFLNGSQRTVLRHFHSGSALARVAVDHLLQLLFYSDTADDVIGVMDTDGGSHRILSDQGLTYPWALVVDVIHEILYYTELFEGSKIARTDYNGSNLEVLINTSILHPHGLALDLKEGRMYWSDQTGKIESAQLDGTDRTLILRDLIYPYQRGLTLFDGVLYFIAHGYSYIFSVTVNGTNRQELTTGPSQYLFDTAVYSESHAITLEDKLAALGPLDACLRHQVVRDADERATRFRTPPGGQPLCDVSLREGWYRFQGGAGQDMPHYLDCPQGSCGTNQTVCLKDAELPAVEEGEVNRTVCKNGNSQCEEEWNIRVRNCGDFRVYFLFPPPGGCPSAYCVGTELRCPDGFCSETGYTPNCDRCPSNVTLAPNVTVGVELRQLQGVQIGAIVFSCNFELPPNASDLRYDVFWYINERQVVNFTGMGGGDLGQTDLKEEHWSSEGLGMRVSCSARTRYLDSSAAGPHFYSNKFFAGLETDVDEVVVEEGGSVTLRLRSTVPLPHVIPQTGSVLGSMEVYVFTPASDSPSLACLDLSRRNVAFQKNPNCGVLLHWSNYSEWVAIEVTGVVDNLYTGDRTAHLKLGVENTPFALPGRKLWNNYTMPDVKVRIRERDAQMAGKICQSFDDPHMTTGDGPRWGWENHREGEFILYKHRHLPLAVHVKYQYCGHVWNGYRVTCNCGVAVQAYDSLVVVDRCSQAQGSLHSLNHVQYLGCGSQHLVLSRSGYSYKVTMPTGTVVEFNVFPYYAPGIGSVSVLPSVADLNSTGGLCGLIDGDVTNDFTLRNGVVTSSSDVFAEDWRASESESLFVENPSLPSVAVGDKTYCTCEVTGDALKPTSQCAMSFPAKRCPQEDSKLLQAFLHSCPGSRRRRDLHLSDLVSDGPSGWQPAEHSVHRDKRQASGDHNSTVPEWTNGWDESRARDHCLAAFRQAGGLELLEQASGLSQTWQRHLDACVLDIQVTGNTSYTQVTVEVYRGLALETASRNVSLLEDEQGRQLMDQVANLSCPRDCSGHGQCVQSTCQCSTGYAGPDCSTDRSTAPQNPYIPQAGLCDTQVRACQSTPVLADNLPDDGQVFCRFQRVPIEGTQGGEVSSRQTTEGQPWLPGQVQCPFPALRSKRQTSGDVTTLGYHVSISNDNVTFSSDVTVIIYDSRCFTCYSSNLTCVPTGRCDDSPTPSQPDSSNASTLIVIVASVVGGLIFILVAVLVGFLIFRKVCNKPKPMASFPMQDAGPSVAPAHFQPPKSGWKE